MRPVNARGASAALSALQREISLQRGQRRVEEIFSEEPVEVALPAYTLMSFTPRARAASWLVPSPRVDFETAVAVYEDFADRPLGKARRLDRVLQPLFRGKEVCWLPEATESEWWGPAVTLMAILSNLSGNPLEGGEECVLLQHEGYKFKVTPNGMHSNFRSQFKYATGRAKDAGRPEIFCWPSVTSKSHLAMVGGDFGQAASWAAAYLLTCQQENVIPQVVKDHLTKPGGLRKGRRPGVLVGGSSGADRIAAVAACREVLEFGGTLLDLYTAMVPYLISARAFKSRFACPWTHPDHGITDRVRNALEEFLAEAERGK